MRTVTVTVTVTVSAHNVIVWGAETERNRTEMKTSSEETSGLVSTGRATEFKVFLFF